MFNGIDPVELSRFKNQKSEMPMACEVILCMPWASLIKIECYKIGDWTDRYGTIRSITVPLIRDCNCIHLKDCIL